MKPTVGLDLDGVCFNLVGGIKDLCRDQLGVHLPLENLNSPDIMAWINLSCPDESVRERVKNRAIITLRSDNQFYANLQPLPGAVEAIWLLTERFRVIGITSRSQCLRKGTMVGMSRHFPPAFSEVLYSKTKPPVAAAQRCVAVIEDSAEVCEQYLAKGRLHVFYVRHRYGRDIVGKRTMGRFTEVPGVLEAAKRLVEMVS